MSEPATDSTPGGWVALHRSEETLALLATYPNAFLLLAQIALRARWKEDCPITGRRTGEAFIGDWRAAGLKSPKAYQVAKARLEKCGLAVFQGGNRGTIARLTSSTVFSILGETRGKQEGNPRGNEGGSDGNQGGSNEQGNKENNGRHSNRSHEIPDVVALYPRREKVAEACQEVAKQIERGVSLDAIRDGTLAIAAIFPRLPSGHLNKYVPSALTFFRDQRWRDDPQTWLRNAPTAANGAIPGKLDLGGRAHTGAYVHTNGTTFPKLDTGGRKPAAIRDISVTVPSGDEEPSLDF